MAVQANALKEEQLESVLRDVAEKVQAVEAEHQVWCCVQHQRYMQCCCLCHFLNYMKMLLGSRCGTGHTLLFGNVRTSQLATNDCQSSGVHHSTEDVFFVLTVLCGCFVVSSRIA